MRELNLGELLEAIATSCQAEPKNAEKAEPTQDTAPSVEVQLASLGNLLRNRTDFEVGTQLTLNNFGEKKYNIRCRGPVVVSHRFSSPVLDRDGELVHGEIAYIGKSDAVVTQVVDFRLFRKI
jgi:hypothetical protein